MSVQSKSTWQKFLDWWRNASIGAAVAENPAGLMASGFMIDIDKEGNMNWKQDPDRPGLEEMREGLAGLGAVGLTAYSAPWIMPYFAPGTIGGDMIGLGAAGKAVHDATNIVYNQFADSKTGDYMTDAFDEIGGNNIENPTLRDVAQGVFSAGDPAYIMGGPLLSRAFGAGQSLINSAVNAGKKVIDNQVNRYIAETFTKMSPRYSFKYNPKTGRFELTLKEGSSWTDPVQLPSTQPISEEAVRVPVKGRVVNNGEVRGLSFTPSRKALPSSKPVSYTPLTQEERELIFNTLNDNGLIPDYSTFNINQNSNGLTIDGKGYHLDIASEDIPSFIEGVRTNGAIDIPTPKSNYGSVITQPSTLSAESPFVAEPLIHESSLNIQIKPLMPGSVLERSVNKKTGTLHISQLQGYINNPNTPKYEKELLSRALQNHQGETYIDYKTLQNEVSSMIPKYNYIINPPQADHYVDEIDLNTYGMQGLGYNIVGNRNLQYGSYVPGITNKIISYVSPGIPGPAAHFDLNSLGFGRFFTLNDDPYTIYFLESQSDKAQSGWRLSNSNVRKSSIQTALNNVKEAYINADNDFDRNQYSEQIEKLEGWLKEFDLDPISARMRDSYTLRQIQQNLEYSASKGYTKMRYPTPETAVKIEGYKKQPYLERAPTDEEIAMIEENKRLYSDKLEQEKTNYYRNALQNFIKDHPGDSRAISKLERLNNGESYIDVMWNIFEFNPENLQFGIEFDPYIDGMNEYISNIMNDFKLPISLDKIIPQVFDYPKEHLTILNKYANFPKEYKKIFGKNTIVREVVDKNGNTWYEVDIPESYRNGSAQIQFKQGGRLKLIPRAKSGIHIKKANRGKFTKSAKEHGMGVQQFASHILANKDKYSSTLVKRANFARNATKFKHKKK